MMIGEYPSARDRWIGATYQIYPRTFNEVRGENEPHQGVGSLKGITEKSDYLKDLGVKAIWISPFYPSPLRDGGYDISNYTDVDPSLGTLDDFDELVDTYHDSDMRVMIDLVPNHTSDQHPWFQDTSKSDWYVWHPGKPDGSPPNNWTSVFSIPQLRARQRGELVVPDGENTPGVSAWTFDDSKGMYYLRDFDATQPNLNWHNPQVRDAMKDVVRFWLRRGVDGFRVDVANHLGKNPDLTDEAPNPNYIEGLHNPHDQHMHFHSLNYPPTLYPYLEELVGILDEPEFTERDTRMILECWMSPEGLQEINRRFAPRASAFNFTRLTAPWKAATHKKLLDTYHQHLPDEATPNHVLSNHDVTPAATRLGAAARSAAVLNLTLPGGPFIYNGEEYGRTNVEVPPERQRDSGLDERDGGRVPISWDSSPNAGFSQASPNNLWLPVDPGHKEHNLDRQMANPNSYYHLYRTLLHFSNETNVMQNGAYTPLETTHPDILAFARRHGHEQVVTFVNFSNEEREVRVKDMQQALGRIVIASSIVRPDKTTYFDDIFTLSAHEAIVVAQTA